MNKTLSPLFRECLYILVELVTLMKFLYNMSNYQFHLNYFSPLFQCRLRSNKTLKKISVPNGIPGNTYVSAYNESALIVYWDPVPDTREVVKGKLKGYKV